MGAFPSPYAGHRRSACANSVIINGRRVPVNEFVRGDELISKLNIGPGRRPVKVSNGSVEQLDSSRYYSSADLVDRRGNPVKISSIPDRTKGAELFSGRRHDWSRRLIQEQVYDIAARYVKGNVDFDQDNSDWMVIPDFRLPRSWQVPTAPLMLVFPRNYPVCPPIGFYLPSWLQSPNGHFYGQAYHGAESAPILEGWNWYCCTVTVGSWQPYPVRNSGDWKRGDNLWTYMTLVNEVLASPAHAS